MLFQEGIVEAAPAGRLMATTRFRNLPVHANGEVDEDRVLPVLHGPLSDLDDLVTALRERCRSDLGE